MDKLIKKIKIVLLIILIGSSSFTNISADEENINTIYNFSNQAKQNFLFSFMQHWLTLTKIKGLLLSSPFESYLYKYCLTQEVPLSDDEVRFEQKCDPKVVFEELPFYNLKNELFLLMEIFIKIEKMSLAEKDLNKVQTLDDLVTDFYSRVEYEDYFEEGDLEIFLEHLYSQINALDNKLPSYLDSLSIWAISQKNFVNYIYDTDVRKAYFNRDMRPIEFWENYLNLYRQFALDNSEALSKVFNVLHPPKREKAADELTVEDIKEDLAGGRIKSMNSLSEILFFAQQLENIENKVKPTTSTKDLL